MNAPTSSPVNRDAAAPQTRFVIQPNGSLSLRGAIVFMVTVSTVALGIGIAFAWMGFWVILPFAGLELTALGAGLFVSLRANRRREVVTVTDDAVECAFGAAGDGPRQIERFARAWARVRLEPGRGRTGKSRLLLGASGRFVELGGCLTDAERERLASRLNEVLAAGATPWRTT